MDIKALSGEPSRAHTYQDTPTKANPFTGELIANQGASLRLSTWLELRCSINLEDPPSSEEVTQTHHRIR
jgi:hypothetical protein